MPAVRPILGSGFAERHSDEPRPVARLHPHQDRALAVLLRVLESAAHVRWIGNFLAADLENDVAGFDALLGGESVWIDLRHHHAVRAATGDLPGGHALESEPRHVGALASGGLGRHRPRFTLVGQLTERHRERLLLTVTPHRQFRGRAGGHAADLLGEISGVFHRGAVDRSDDVAGLDARLRGRTIRLRLGDQRALRRLQPKIVGDLRSDGLDLHADPAAGDLTAVLELCDDRLHRRSGDRKGDTYRTAGRRKDGGIDADHVTVDIEGRATRIAFVDRSIDLNEVVVGTGSDIPTTGRDDAGRYPAPEAD